MEGAATVVGAATTFGGPGGDRSDPAPEFNFYVSNGRVPGAQAPNPPPCTTCCRVNNVNKLYAETEGRDTPAVR